MKHTLYFDRRLNSIDGLVTLQTNDGKKIFERLPARSGQRGWTHTSWQRGKSPCPFGRFWMSTKPVPLQMEPVGTPFFPIYTDEANKRIIYSVDGYRMDIGAHFDNRFPGSLGCIAVVREGIYKEKAEAMFKYLEALYPTEPQIQVVVL